MTNVNDIDMEINKYIVYKTGLVSLQLFGLVCIILIIVSIIHQK
jgi:hypothetical protein